MKNFDSPLKYTHSKKAWMTGFIFKNWFYNLFVKQVREYAEQNNLPPKGLLLVDNCSAHPQDLIFSYSGLIVIMFLPPNSTSLIQPMDQNPIKNTKLIYRNGLLASIISQPSENIHDVKDAIILLKSSWDKVSETVLRNSWKKLFEHLNDEVFDDCPYQTCVWLRLRNMMKL